MIKSRVNVQLSPSLCKHASIWSLHLDKNVNLDPHFSESLSNKPHDPKVVKCKDQIDTKYLISGTNLILGV